jgi:hypothetical protein
MEDTKWFARLAEVPKVGYFGHPNVDPRRLPGHGTKPKVESFDFDGTLHRSLYWQTAEGSTSQSPASAWCSFDDPRHATAAGVLRRIYEALELPGTAADYHFALLHSYEILWNRFRERADLLPELEQLLLLDIALVESRPDILQIGGEDQTFWANVPAFYHLMRLYEREGYLEDALAIARRGAALRQGGDDLQRLEQRVVALSAESPPNGR